MKHQTQSGQLTPQSALLKEEQLLHNQVKNSSIDHGVTSDFRYGQNQNVTSQNYQGVNNTQWPAGQNIHSIVQSSVAAIASQSISTCAFAKSGANQPLVIFYI